MKPMGLDSSAGAESRRERISQLVEANGRASVAQLSQLLSVSEATVRKDLAVLESEGRLLRTHGGATVGRSQGAGMRSRDELAFEVRRRLQVAQKTAIGRAAAGPANDGDTTG